MKTVSCKVPRSIAELKGLGVLGDQVVNDYGQRLVKLINSFVETNELEEYLNSRPKKRTKTSNESKKSVIVIDDDEEDEFDSIDFGTVDLTQLPDSKPAATGAKEKAQSRFFD